MQVTTKITVDLTRQNVGQRVNAVQGDGNTRLVEITLLCGGAPWTPPDGVEAAIAYMTPVGTKGLYNKLADDTAAISISGNVATVILAPQMLTASGTVQASLVFNDSQLNRLTTFPFAVSVTSNPAAGAQKVEDYLRLQWLEDKLDEYVKNITEGIVPGGAVSSVNGKTGAVVLTAGDVHALPDNTVIPTVPEKVSAFENDAGYLTEHQDISGKVDKVAGKGLSTHDYDNAAKAKVDAIPEDPKYTDTVYDDTEVKQSLSQIKNENADKLKGHTWSVLGDSISHDDMYTNKQYWDYLSERCGGLTVYNYGVSGHRITDMVTRYGAMNNSDIITVFGGVNDWGQGNPTPIGEFGDSDTSTFYGALNVLLKGLLTKFPKSLIVFILPLGNKGFSGLAEDKNELGYTLEHYIDAIISVCERYKVPFVDTRKSKLTPYVETTKLLYFVDGLHLNAYGHEVLSYEIESELKCHYIPTVSDSNETTPVISSISATYNGGDVTIGTAITELTGIVVTAHYSDGSTKTVTGYTLSGEIVEGENSITVSYGGKTTTFTVTGVSSPGESIVEVAMSDVGVLANRSYLNTGKTATYDGWETYSNKLDVSGYSSITGRFCCHYLPFVANVPYIVFFGKEDEVVGWEGLKINVGESEKEDENGGYGYSIERTFAIPDGAVTAALNGTTYFFDAYNNSGTYRLRRAK